MSVNPRRMVYQCARCHQFLMADGPKQESGAEGTFVVVLEREEWKMFRYPILSMTPVEPGTYRLTRVPDGA